MRFKFRRTKIKRQLKRQLSIKSLKRFLIFYLLTAFTFIMLVLSIINYIQLRHENDRIFRLHLLNSAQVLAALTINNEDIKTTQYLFSNYLDAATGIVIKQLANSHDFLDEDFAEYYQRYDAHIIFQIWNTKTNQLLLRSAQAPDDQYLSNKALGFETIVYQQRKWTAFTLIVPQRHLRITIAINAQFQHNITDIIFFHDLLVLIAIYIIVIILIFLIISCALSPIQKIADLISQRKSNYLDPIHFDVIPQEIKPFVRELNNLFTRIENALSRERRFTADAAHELKTPLAALKTQVEVAQNEKDSLARNKMLGNIIICVDRCSHAIEQLLTLARLEPEQHLQHQSFHAFDITLTCEQIVAEVAPIAIEKDIDIELIAPNPPYRIYGNEIAIGILLRNLLDNAIIYTAQEKNHKVQVLITHSHETISLHVIDHGPGIPDNLKKRIFERFYRQVGNSAPGTGLGLSIVTQICKSHHAEVKAVTPNDEQGLEIVVTFGKASTFAYQK